MSAMVVDRSVSTLNPNAPVFDPVGFREVEDFSPKWWELVTTSKWFRDFCLSANSEYEFGAGDEFSDMEEEFEELIMSSDEAEAGGSTVSGNENTLTHDMLGRFGRNLDPRQMLVSLAESDVDRYLKVLLSMTKGKLYRSNVSISSCSPKYNQKKTSPNFNCRRNHHINQPR